MKRKINFPVIIVFMLMFCSIETACAKIDENEVLNSSLTESSNIDSEEIIKTSMDEISTMKSAETTESPVIETTTKEFSECTESQIVEAICIELYGFNEEDAFNHADYMMNIAESLSERSLGNIISEEDAVQKARSVLVEIVGTEYIERIESDFVELNGEKIKYQRSNTPYNADFYEEYDVWLINTNLPSGITDDGRRIATPGMTPYVIIRESDGKVLATFR